MVPPFYIWGFNVEGVRAFPTVINVYKIGEQVQGKKHTKEKKPRLRLGFGVEREVISPGQDLLIFYLWLVPCRVRM